MPTPSARDRKPHLPGFGPGLLLLLLPVLALVLGSCQPQQSSLKFGGGPRGGTFENIAAELATILNENLSGVRITVEPSAGSLANLLDVEQGKMSMGLVFAGDAYLARQGRLKEDLMPTTGIMALARLYGATAHLVVANDSSIRTVQNLRGRRVAIGSSGSGAALTARRFFQSIGLWESIIPIHQGYTLGMEDLRWGNVDAVWLQVGYPSEYLLEISGKMPLRFLSLIDATAGSDFFTAYPFYRYTLIPAGTYAGQAQDILTFQDAALWVASSQLSDQLAYLVLRALFSEPGLAKMKAAHSAAWDLSITKGLMGVNIPLHPGARRFWQEQGIVLPP